MKRLSIYVFLGPVLFVLCIWVLFLPVASLVEGGAVRFNLEVDSYLGLLLALMVGGLALAVADWLAEILVMRPWFTAALGGAIGAAMIGSWFDLSRPIWWWFIFKGLLVAMSALCCSWLVKRGQRARTQ